MGAVKLAVIFYSMTGTNYRLAQWAAEGGKEQGAEVRLLQVPELAPEETILENPAWKEHVDHVKDVPVVTLQDLEWADALIFSVPTRYGTMPGQLKQFLDTTGKLWFHGKLVNKVVSAMASAQNPHGGQEQTILGIYTAMYHWGAIIVSPGYTDPSLFTAGGNPYGTSVTVQNGKMVEDVQAAVKHQAKRTVDVAKWIVAGSN
ncbi:NAD(P)H:quinone oxidoreductase [Paenibacillus sp. chi10]|uniref:NAD(P)H:quinone oxidoreductase n=1 Tax=Paenibacillus suaedae TaxID=3077233 RepID=A0AAJ2JVI5_9BACL|nr:NAD(P)H:quinone oxidoreductase [Paenibacillus sp. chi10]MDT8977501.1 NAD(P)H:quinone oxidoreductase [Paenibacillus sp. chi10]